MPRSDRNKRDLHHATASGGASAVLLPVSVTGNPLFSAVGEAGRHVLAIADAYGGSVVTNSGNDTDGANGGGTVGKGNSSNNNSSSGQSARDK